MHPSEFPLDTQNHLLGQNSELFENAGVIYSEVQAVVSTYRDRESKTIRPAFGYGIISSVILHGLLLVARVPTLPATESAEPNLAIISIIVEEELVEEKLEALETETVILDEVPILDVPLPVDAPESQEVFSEAPSFAETRLAPVPVSFPSPEPEEEIVADAEVEEPDSEPNAGEPETEKSETEFNSSQSESSSEEPVVASNSRGLRDIWEDIRRRATNRTGSPIDSQNRDSQTSPPSTGDRRDSPSESSSPASRTPTSTAAAPTTRSPISTPPPATPPPATPAPTPPVGSRTVACRSCPQPSYPRSALRSGVEGTVSIGVDISSGGRVTSAYLVGSSGSGDLDQTALRTVRNRWRFQPIDGGASGVVVQVVMVISGSDRALQAEEQGDRRSVELSSPPSPEPAVPTPVPVPETAAAEENEPEALEPSAPLEDSLDEPLASPDEPLAEEPIEEPTPEPELIPEPELEPIPEPIPELEPIPEPIPEPAPPPPIPEPAPLPEPGLE